MREKILGVRDPLSARTKERKASIRRRRLADTLAYAYAHSSTCLLAAFAAANVVAPAAAQKPPSINATQDPKERCAQLIAFFDRYGASRTENSDGRRNHTRIGAEIDCKRGRYQEGIMAMEDLLRRKKFDVASALACPLPRDSAGG